jgi:L1 cell adhesion molecule like protein
MALVDTVTKVIKVAMEIKKLVETVQRNKEDCKKIAANVERLRAIVACLASTPVANAKTMIDILNGLEESFLRAIKLIKVCQTKNTAWSFLTAGSISKQLREVKAEIMEHVNFAIFSNVVQQSVFITSENPPACSVHYRMVLLKFISTNF